MAKVVKTIAKGIILRRLVSVFMKSVQNHPLVSQLTGVFGRLILQIPGAAEAGSEVIDNLPDAWRSSLSPIWRRVLNAGSGKTDESEDDDMKRKRDNRKDTRRQAPTGPDLGFDSVQRANRKILQLGEGFGDYLLDRIATDAKPMDLDVIALVTLGNYAPGELRTLVIRLKHLGADGNLLTEIWLSAPPATLGGGAPAGISAHLDNSLKCREILDWVLEEDGDSHVVYLKITSPMTSDENDSDNDRPNWEQWLANFHHLGKEKAFRQLKLITDTHDENQIAKLAGVRANYVTKGIKVLKTQLRKLTVIRRVTYTTDHLDRLERLHNSDLKRHGLPLLGVVGATDSGTTSSTNEISL